MRRSTQRDIARRCPDENVERFGVATPRSAEVTWRVRWPTSSPTSNTSPPAQSRARRASSGVPRNGRICGLDAERVRGSPKRDPRARRHRRSGAGGSDVAWPRQAERRGDKLGCLAHMDHARARRLTTKDLLAETPSKPPMSRSGTGVRRRRSARTRLRRHLDSMGSRC
jgi:hypothetical protein